MCPQRMLGCEASWFRVLLGSPLPCPVTVMRPLPTWPAKASPGQQPSKSFNSRMLPSHSLGWEEVGLGGRGPGSCLLRPPLRPPSMALETLQEPGPCARAGPSVRPLLI